MSVIKYAVGSTIVVEFDEIYYIRSDVRFVFNQSMVRQSIPNLDDWVLAKTGNIHSYQQIIYMAEAFKDGIQSGYSWNDITWAATESFKYTKSLIFSSEYTTEYIKSYWIELTGPNELRTKIVDYFEKNFDKLLDTFGSEKLSNILYRYIKHSENCAKDTTPIFTRLYDRVGHAAGSAGSVDTSIIDVEIANKIRTTLIGPSQPQYKNIPGYIISQATAIQSIDI